ncbi:hypothetical protein G7083_07345 [Vibrio sp. HDW18]|uniref:hypothetical protein n=1 Tax=Vibrio sp. HDW18 TaxID=2714948 RepID=UPI00140B5AEA|nr:hypothetical protein [Vibrio sp. HDW18]QIL85686.1 hypothetical protein G7083_07345 [Vibrio sp. HDW18]
MNVSSKVSSLTALFESKAAESKNTPTRLPVRGARNHHALFNGGSNEPSTMSTPRPQVETGARSTPEQQKSRAEFKRLLNEKLGAGPVAPKKKVQPQPVVAAQAKPQAESNSQPSTPTVTSTTTAPLAPPPPPPPPPLPPSLSSPQVKVWATIDGKALDQANKAQSQEKAASKVKASTFAASQAEKMGSKDMMAELRAKLLARQESASQ